MITFEQFLQLSKQQRKTMEERKKYLGEMLTNSGRERSEQKTYYGFGSQVSQANQGGKKAPFDDLPWGVKFRRIFSPSLPTLFGKISLACCGMHCRGPINRNRPLIMSPPKKLLKLFHLSTNVGRKLSL